MNWTDFAKFARASALLSMGGVIVYADTRRPGCQVYSSARGADVALAFARDSDPRIPDLDLTPAAISGTLVFGGGAYHHCVLPWTACWGVRLATSNDLTDGLVVWPESVPPDVEPALVSALKGMGIWRPERPL